MMKLTAYKDDKAQFRWNVKGRNNEIMAQGEGYKSKAALVKTLGKLFGTNEVLAPQLAQLCAKRGL